MAAETPMVWTAQSASHDGGSLHGVFATREVAVEWLAHKHALHAVLAAGMDRHRAEEAKKHGFEPDDPWEFTPITVRADGSAEFTEGGDTYLIRPRVLQESFTPDERELEIIEEGVRDD